MLKESVWNDLESIPKPHHDGDIDIRVSRRAQSFRNQTALYLPLLLALNCDHAARPAWGQTTNMAALFFLDAVRVGREGQVQKIICCSSW